MNSYRSEAAYIDINLDQFFIKLDVDDVIDLSLVRDAHRRNKERIQTAIIHNNATLSLRSDDARITMMKEQAETYQEIYDFYKENGYFKRDQRAKEAAQRKQLREASKAVEEKKTENYRIDQSEVDYASCTKSKARAYGFHYLSVRSGEMRTAQYTCECVLLLPNNELIDIVEAFNHQAINENTQLFLVEKEAGIYNEIVNRFDEILEETANKLGMKVPHFKKPPIFYKGLLSELNSNSKEWEGLRFDFAFLDFTGHVNTRQLLWMRDKLMPKMRRRSRIAVTQKQSSRWHYEQNFESIYKEAIEQHVFGVHRREFDKMVKAGNHRYITDNIIIQAFLSNHDESLPVIRPSETRNGKSQPMAARVDYYKYAKDDNGTPMCVNVFCVGVRGNNQPKIKNHGEIVESVLRGVLDTKAELDEKKIGKVGKALKKMCKQ